MLDDTFPEGKPATDPMYELRLLRTAMLLLHDTRVFTLEAHEVHLIAQQVLNVLTHGTRHAPHADARTDGPFPANPAVLDGEMLRSQFRDAPQFDVVNVPGSGPIYFPTEQPMPESYTAMERAHQLGYQVTQSGPGLTPEAHAAWMPGLRQAAREAYEQVWKGKLDDKKSDGCYTAMDLFWLDPLIKRYFATKRGCAQVPGEGM